MLFLPSYIVGVFPAQTVYPSQCWTQECSHHSFFLGCESKDPPSNRNKQLLSSLQPLLRFLQPDCEFHCTTVLLSLLQEDCNCLEPHFSLPLGDLGSAEEYVRDCVCLHMCGLGREGQREAVSWSSCQVSLVLSFPSSWDPWMQPRLDAPTSAFPHFLCPLSFILHI